MKRGLVGGILTAGSRILLVRSDTGGPSVNGLWSLPTAEVREHESHEQALLRGVRAAAGREARVTRALPSHEGPEFTFTVFEGTLSDSAHEPGASECALFAFNELPQQMQIDSMLCIAKHQIVTGQGDEHPFSLIDRVFTAAFYSHIAPHREWFGLTADTDVYWYIVVSTPHRKFKSVVPFLLSKCNPTKAHLYLIPEICFAIWTLLDDCHDETSYRYGQKSALLRFGSRESVIVLFRSLHSMAGILRESLSSPVAEKIVSALSQSASALRQRDQNGLDKNLDTYLEESAKRTEFLRAAWVGILEELGCDGTKREILYEIQRRSSMIGQLINDYFDIERGRLWDFDHRVASSHSLLLIRHAGDDDRALLRRLWSGAEGGRERYRALLEKYDIAGILRQMIRGALTMIVDNIERERLEGDEKAVLVAWHQMSFVHFYPEVRDAGALAPFVKSVERLLASSPWK